MRKLFFAILTGIALGLMGGGLLLYALGQGQVKHGQVGRYQSVQGIESGEMVVLDTSSGTLYLVGKRDSSADAVSATLNVVTAEMVTRKLIRKSN